MHFAAPFAAILAVASAFPAELVQRASDLAPQVLVSLDYNGKNGTAVNGTINAQPAGNVAYTPAQQTALVNANAALAKSINNTAAIANASAAFTDAESLQIYNFVNTTSRPIVFSVLDNLIAHYGNVKAANQVPLVKFSLTNQRELTRELSNSLTTKGTAKYQTQSNALRDTILAKYDSAITKFSS